MVHGMMHKGSSMLPRLINFCLLLGWGVAAGQEEITESVDHRLELLPEDIISRP